MARTYRGARRVQHLLEDAEAIVTSLTGAEVDGRRGRVVLLTDRRLLVGWLRDQPPLELDPDAVAGSYERSGRLLTLQQGRDQVTLRAVDELAARALLDLLRHRRDARLCGDRETQGPRVRTFTPERDG